MFTGRPNVPGRAVETARDWIARSIAIGRSRAAFLAPVAKVTLRARLTARRAGPSAGADTFAGGRIAGRVVVAGADLAARIPVVTERAATFTVHTAPLCLADAAPGGHITRQRVFQMAIAQLLTVLPEPARGALLVTQITRPTGRTRTLPIDRVAGTSVLAAALFGTVAPVMLRIARPIALDALPARGANALARITLAGRPVHALAPLAAVLPVRVVRARFFTAFALETGYTEARSINVGAG